MSSGLTWDIEWDDRLGYIDHGIGRIESNGQIVYEQPSDGEE